VLAACGSSAPAAEEAAAPAPAEAAPAPAEEEPAFGSSLIGDIEGPQIITDASRPTPPS